MSEANIEKNAFATLRRHFEMLAMPIGCVTAKVQIRGPWI